MVRSDFDSASKNHVIFFKVARPNPAGFPPDPRFSCEKITFMYRDAYSSRQ